MLETPNVPFPVSSSQRIRPDLVRLEEPLFAIDTQHNAYLTEKRSLRNEPWTALLSPEATSDPSGVIEALDQLEQQMRASHPLLAGEIERVRSLKWPESASQKALAWGTELALSVQEDIALMHGNKLEAAWVFLPSRWNPAEKIGLDFARIHVPVPHSDKLQAAQHNVAKAMSEKGPFVRYVWGLSYDPNLCQHPSRPRWDGGETVYFRTERQITAPLPELERSWFLIRVYNVPLAEVLTTPERKVQLANALQSMTPEHIAYKNMGRIIPRVLEELL